MENKIIVKRAAELDRDVSKEISDIFVAGFYQWLQFFSKDEARLSKAFAHIYNPEVFYVALSGDKIAGITACTDGQVPSVILDKKELRKHLGFIRGNIAYAVLKREFETKKYPFDIPAGMGMIEFVAISPDYRRQGVAEGIIRYIWAETAYEEYALEVADTNEKAVRLYHKLGFKEFMQIKQKHSKHSGVNSLIYMKTEKTK